MKRPRSSSYVLFPPIVVDYRPYTSGMLERQHGTIRPARDQWDCYYRNNTTNGYKDRHYILREFVELREAIEASQPTSFSASQRRAGFGTTPTADSSVNAADGDNGAPMNPTFSWLELGCGVGNAFLPIFEAFGHLPQWTAMYGADISHVAIELLRSRVSQTLPALLQEKVHTCVLDPTQTDLCAVPTLTSQWDVVVVSDKDKKEEPEEQEEPQERWRDKKKRGDSLSSALPTAVSASPRALLSPHSSSSSVFTSMIFVLSSIEVQHHRIVLQRAAQWMREACGGRRRVPPPPPPPPPTASPSHATTFASAAVFFFRDYAAEDHAQHRFCRRHRCVEGEREGEGEHAKWCVGDERVGSMMGLDRNCGTGYSLAAVHHDDEKAPAPAKEEEEEEKEVKVEDRGMMVGIRSVDKAKSRNPALVAAIGRDGRGKGMLHNNSSHNKNSSNHTTFVRSNGTLTHFFQLEEVRQLFTDAGFAVIDLRVVEREVHNRGEGIQLQRRFIQGRFALA